MSETIDIGTRLAEMGTDAAIDELRRIMQGAADRQRIRLSVPDLDAAMAQYQEGDGGMEAIVMADGRFKSLWNRTKLQKALDRSGFLVVDMRTEANMLEAVAMKYPLPEPSLPMKNITAIQSLPRVTWTTPSAMLHEACMLLGIPCTRSTGVFWGQCMESMIEGCVKDGMEYILTVDYDSIFDAHDVVRLWQVMEANPDIAALCPMQIQRDRVNTLCSMVDENGNHKTSVSLMDFETDAVDIASGHFGLTLIRVSSLAGVQRPLFHSVPDKDGGWGDGKVDEDITFWKRMQAAGRRIAICPRVRIGHLQLVITWPNDQFQAVHQYHPDFIKSGRPSFSAPR